MHYDGVARLNIARRVLDHPVPHYSHLGTVWLPLPHLLLLPWVRNDFLWSTGLAGSLISALAFWAACYWLYALSRLTQGREWAGSLSVAAFASNPNILYLQSTPLGEMLYVALFLATLTSLMKFTQQASLQTAVTCGGFALLASLTRYDGWLLAPLGAMVVFAASVRRRSSVSRLVLLTAVYLIIALSGIAGWLAYNQVAFNDPLAFLRGEHATERNIGRIVAEAGLEHYPPRGDAVKSVAYYREAVRLGAGDLLFIGGGLGFLVFAWRMRRSWLSPEVWAAGFCFLLPLMFYIANMMRGTGIIYVPSLPPKGILNVRYAALFIPGLCLFLPEIITPLLQGIRRVAGTLGRTRWLAEETGARNTSCVIFAALLMSGIWQVTRGMPGVAFYHEAYVNGFERKQTDHQAASFFRSHYDGQRILIDLGHHGIVPQQARIPLVKFINEATAWESALARPSLFVGWIVVQEGDGVWKFPVNSQNVEQEFEKVFEASSPFERPLRVYRKLARGDLRHSRERGNPDFRLGGH
ncbi:MAG: hypothetical protein L0387_12875 [Acidobacteria bacterium]|nr:hypothetical protein [Acidobacteriota bacterium]